MPDHSSADAPQQRYHSSLSRRGIARSESTRSGLTGKLQSLRKKIESELSRKRPGSQSQSAGGGGRNGYSPEHAVQQEGSEGHGRWP